MPKHVVFLSGPIGVGKTTLGRCLADKLSGIFIDGDDHSDSDRPWYCSILQTSRSIIRHALEILEKNEVVIIAYPLGCMNWIYFRRKFTEFGINPVFVSLRASYASIVGGNRGRIFSIEEHDRIQVMIAEGYGDRAFSDYVIDTDKLDFQPTLALLESDVRRSLGL